MNWEESKPEGWHNLVVVWGCGVFLGEDRFPATNQPLTDSRRVLLLNGHVCIPDWNRDQGNLVARLDIERRSAKNINHFLQRRIDSPIHLPAIGSGTNCSSSAARYSPGRGPLNSM